MLFTVVTNAALDSPRIEKVSDQNRGLKPRSHRIKMEGSSPEVQHTFRSPVTAKNVEQVAIRRLVTKGIVAVERWQALAWSGARNVLFAVIVEQVSDV